MSSIDLSQTPAPDVVEEIDFEDQLAGLKDLLVNAMPKSVRPALRETLSRETDPLPKTLEAIAYLSMNQRQRINEAAQDVLLPYSSGATLDGIAVLFGVRRLLIDPPDTQGQPPTAPIYETDDALRRRVLLSLEGLSVAGPPGSYIYHALSASGGVLDASVDAPRFDGEAVLDDGRIAWRVTYSAGLEAPRPGCVVIALLGREHDGTPSESLIETVRSALYKDNVRPATDLPIVRPAEIVSYQIDATIYVLDGPDSSIVVSDARRAVVRYVESTHRLGYDVTLSGIYAALHQPGVQRVELAEPTESIEIGPQQASYCTGINLDFGGRAE